MLKLTLLLMPRQKPPNETPAATNVAPVSDTVGIQVVSDGDAAVGANIFMDTSCPSGGVGCIDDVYRFCKVRTTDNSAASAK